MGDPTAPNQGATGDVSAEEAAAMAGDTPPSGFEAVEDGAFSSRPELFVAGAFLGGFALAQLLKRVRG